MAAQVVTITEGEGIDNRKFNGVQKIIWDWKSATGGAVSSATTYKYSGQIIWVAIIPDGGATAPSADYDMTIKADDGIDLLAGNGVDCAAAANEYLGPGTEDLGAMQDSKLTLAIANAGDEKGGIVAVFIR